MNLENTLKFAPLALGIGSSLLAQWYDGGRMLENTKVNMRMGVYKFSLITMGIVSLMQFARGDINNMVDITLPVMFAEFTKGATDDNVLMRWMATLMSSFITYRHC